MDQQPIDGRTLRDLMKDLELAYREFADHLRRGFSPRIEEFARTIQQRLGNEDAKTTQRTVRNALQPTLESHAYSREVFQRFQQLISAVDARLREIVNVG